MSNFRNGMRPIHPGETLREEYLAPLGMTPHALASALNVAASWVDDIICERRGVTPDMALHLARYFGGDAESWLNLQQTYDLKVAMLERGGAITRETSPHQDI